MLRCLQSDKHGISASEVEQDDVLQLLHDEQADPAHDDKAKTFDENGKKKNKIAPIKKNNEYKRTICTTHFIMLLLASELLSF